MKNAALQGIILFASGYAAVLLAISANTVETKYDHITRLLQPCSLLRYCDRHFEHNAQGPKDYELKVNEFLSKHGACQEVHIKKAISVGDPEQS